MKAIIFALMLLAATADANVQASPRQSLPPGDKPPPTRFERIATVGTAEDFDDAAYVIVCDSITNSVNDRGISYIDGYILYKVLTEQGCRDLSVITWGYEPLSSYVEILAVNVIRDTTAIPVPVENVLDLPAPQSAIYWGDRIKILQLPHLQVGDGIEVQMYRKGYSYALLDSEIEPDDERYIPPMPGQYFDVVHFQANVPIVRKIYLLQLPANKRLHSQIYNGPMYSSTSYLADTTTYAWWIEGAPAWHRPRYGLGTSDAITKVVLATVESWEAKSAWFFEVNEGQFAVTDAIQSKVDEILAGAGVADGTEEEKAFELVHWVAQNIRYSGQTMGEGEGYTLHSGAMILEQRSGVCKDIAGMLITMMRAAGMDSYGAMTMAGSRIEEIPADQFNHCVVALKKDDGGFVMYDPTWVGNYRDIWSKYECEQHYLIGTPQGEPLNQIAYSPPEESSLRLNNTGTLLPDGTFEGTLELRGEGVMDSRLRGMLTRTRLPELTNSLARLLHPISDRVELTGYEHGDLFDFSNGMWWKIKYRIPEYALMVNDNYEFKSPMMVLTTKGERLFSPAAFDWSEKREDAVFFWSAELFDGRETIKLPKGYRVTAPKVSKEIDETYAYFRGESKMTGKELVITQRVETRRRQVPPDGYGGLRRAMKEAQEYGGTLFRAEKGGAK